MLQALDVEDGIQGRDIYVLGDFSTYTNFVSHSSLNVFLLHFIRISFLLLETKNILTIFEGRIEGYD